MSKEALEMQDKMHTSIHWSMRTEGTHTHYGHVNLHFISLERPV